jgi:hypothetical protein
MLSYHQPQSYSMCVQVLGALDESEKFKKFVLVVQVNPDTGVDHGNLQELLLVFEYYLGLDLNFSDLGKLDGVGLQTEEDLHHAVLICVDKGAVHAKASFVIFFGNIDKVTVKIDSLLLCFDSLNVHDFFDRFSDVKFCEVFAEFSGLDL